MKSVFVGFLFLQFFCACNTGDKEATPASENDVDAARNFINAVLKQEFTKARSFLLNDSANYENLNITERIFNERLTPDDKKGFRESTINVHEVKTVNDSTTIVYYSNSYKKQRDSLEIIRQNGQWLVDLKYSFPATEFTDSLTKKDAARGH